MNILNNFTFICLLTTLFSCEEQTIVHEIQCDSSLSLPVKVEFELLTGTCLDNYIGSINQFRIKNESEYESIMDQFECEEFPTINFIEKELLGSIFSFTGTNETKEEFSVNRDGNLVEVLHCINVIPNDEKLTSNVETYLLKWVLIDKLNSVDSVIFTVNQN